jgi:hypothetical protein
MNWQKYIEEDLNFDDLHVLGEGSWTRAFKMDNGQVLLRSQCKVKKAISQGLFPDSPLFPEITEVWYDAEREVTYYTMELLEPGSFHEKENFGNSLSPESKIIWEQLIPLDNFMYSLHMEMSRIDFWIKKFQNNLPNALANLMISVLRACDTDNTGNVGFEIPMHNIACKDGQLVLFDCFCNFTP